MPPLAYYGIVAGMNWEALADEVIRRRVHLGYEHRADFAAAKGFPPRTLSDIERHRRQNFGRDTLAKLEKALEWPEGRVQAILTTDQRAPAIDVDNVNAAAAAYERIRTAITAQAEDPSSYQRLGVPPTRRNPEVRLLAEEIATLLRTLPPADRAALATVLDAAVHPYRERARVARGVPGRTPKAGAT